MCRSRQSPRHTHHPSVKNPALGAHRMRRNRGHEARGCRSSCRPKPHRGAFPSSMRSDTQRASPHSGAIARGTHGDGAAQKREPPDRRREACRLPHAAQGGEEIFLERRPSAAVRPSGGARKKTLGGPVTFLKYGSTLYCTTRSLAVAAAPLARPAPPASDRPPPGPLRLASTRRSRAGARNG